MPTGWNKVLILLTLIYLNIFAENTSPKNDFIISGYIIDAETKHAVSYANVLLFSADSKQQVKWYGH